MIRALGCLLGAALLAGCTTAVAGTPSVPPMVGAALSGGGLDVTLVSYLDPAPLYQANEYDSKPGDGNRLVAAQFRVKNTGGRDYLVDPITEVSVTAGGKQYETSLADTSAGVMLDQVSLSPGQTVLGYVTLDVPSDEPVTQVRYEPMHGSPMTWLAAPAGPHQTPPWPDARKGAHRLGEPVTITGEGSQLVVAATKVTDPATPQPRVDVGAGRHVVQVDFTANDNTGRPDGDPQLRIITLYDAADEPVRAHVYSMEDTVERPLTAGVPTPWPVQFAAPDGFVPDHVSFRPEYGNNTTTTWALS